MSPRTVNPRLARAALAAMALVLAPAAPAAAEPAPCNGIPQIVDVVGDGHHAATDVERAWFAEEDGRVRAVIRVHLGTWLPSHEDAQQPEAGYALVFTAGGATRYVRARVPLSGIADATFDTGAFSTATGFTSAGTTTGAVGPAVLGPASLVIDVPEELAPDGAVLGAPYVLTYDGIDLGEPHWVDRAPGGVSPATTEVGSDFTVGACDRPPVTTTGVLLIAPASRTGAGRVEVTGRIAPARAGIPVEIATSAGGPALATALSTATGAFSATVRLRETSLLIARAEGIAASPARVAIRSRVTIAVRRLRGGVVEIRGWTDPALPGSALLLGVDDVVPTARRAVVAGRFTIRSTHIRRGRYQVVYIPARGRAVRSTSNTVRVRRR